MAAAASTWTNIATKLNSCASDLDRVCTGRLADQESLAIATFRTLQAGSASHLRMIDQLTGAISGGLTVALMIVRMVHDMVRDATSNVIGKLTSRVATGVLTADLIVPWTVSTAITKASSWVTRLSKGVANTALSAKNLRGLLTEANRLPDDVIAAFNRIPAEIGEAATTKVGIAKGLVSSLSNPQHALADLPGIGMHRAGDMGKAKPIVHRPTGGLKPPKTLRPNPNEGRWGRRLDGAPTKSDPRPTTNGGEGTPSKDGDDGRGGDGSDPMNGPVVFKPFKGASEADVKTLHEYIAGRNQVLREGKLFPTGRVTTEGAEIDRQIKRATQQERRARPEKYPPPDIAAGHVPDSTWLGHGGPLSWQTMSSKLSSSLARQDNNYPVGYKPAGFLVGGGD